MLCYNYVLCICHMDTTPYEAASTHIIQWSSRSGGKYCPKRVSSTTTVLEWTLLTLEGRHGYTAVQYILPIMIIGAKPPWIQHPGLQLCNQGSRKVWCTRLVDHSILKLIVISVPNATDFNRRSPGSLWLREWGAPHTAYDRNLRCFHHW